MSFPSFTATGIPPAAPAGAGAGALAGGSGSGSGSGGLAPARPQQQQPGQQPGQQPPPPPPPPPPSRQTSSHSHSTYQWGRLDQRQQQQQQQQPGQQPGQPQGYFGAAADPQARPTHGSLISGISPSESAGSLAQYGSLVGAGGLGGLGGSAGSLLMAGPGSLCAALPRYVRHPPIEAVVFGWGVSDDGQLGLAEGRGDVKAPKVVEALLGVQFSGRGFSRTPLVAGSRNTLALDAAGQVWSFGWNDRGTLGHGHRSRETKPKRIAALKGIRVVQVAIGGWHCLALSDRGTMFAWGGNEYGQCGTVRPGQRDITEPLPVDLRLGPNQRVRQVAAGGMHSLALLEDGTVWQWGENWGDFSMHPVRTPRPVPGGVAVAAVCCGAFHNLALTAGGRVLSWGMNDYGQLGNGSTTYATAPRPVLDMDGVVVADIAAGGWHSCALSSAGEVWVWGRGEYGRLGLGDRSGSSKLRPQKVRGLESHVVVQLAAGGSHTLALTSTARLFVWGRGAFGRLGLSNPERDCYHPVECALPGGTERWRVAAIGAGGRHSMCLAIPVRDTATAGGLDDLEMELGDDLALAAAAAAQGFMLPHHLMMLGAGGGGGDPGAVAAAAAAIGGGGFGSVIPAQLQHLASLGRLHQALQRNGSEEYDNLDGMSEPSLYDRDVQGEPQGEPSPVRTRRQTAATADGSITAASSIAAIASMVGGASGGGGSGAAAPVGGSSGGGGGGGGASQGAPLPLPPLPPPDLQPLNQGQGQGSSLSDWPSIDSSGVAPSGDSASMTAPPPTPTDAAADAAAAAAAASGQPQPVLPSRAGSGVSATSSIRGSVGGAPLSPPPSVASRSASSSTAAAAAAAAPPSPSLLTLRPGSVLVPPPPPSPAVPPTAADADAPMGPVESPRAQAVARPKSPLPGSVPLPPLRPYGMRRSSSAIGSLTQLSQILPEPAAVAAAAVLDADSDLGPPRGLAAAAAAVAAAAAAAAASGPSSLHGSVGNGGGGGPGSRNGSVTGMATRGYRTVFGGGGEEEDEATQAAEAAEAAAEQLYDGSSAGEDELGGELEGEQDDTDEDQVYDNAAVQHPRSPSMMSRPRSPPVPLSPRRHASFNMHPAAAISAVAAAAAAGGSRSTSPSMMAAGAVSGSPSSRSLVASYGSPRVPSTMLQ